MSVRSRLKITTIHYHHLPVARSSMEWVLVGHNLKGNVGGTELNIMQTRHDTNITETLS